MNAVGAFFAGMGSVYCSGVAICAGTGPGGQPVGGMLTVKHCNIQSGDSVTFYGEKRVSDVPLSELGVWEVDSTKLIKTLIGDGIVYVNLKVNDPSNPPPPLSPAQLGQVIPAGSAKTVGYGKDEFGNSGLRKEAAVQLTAKDIGQGLIEVRGSNNSMFHSGDSGGGLFTIEESPKLIGLNKSSSERQGNIFGTVLSLDELRPIINLITSSGCSDSGAVSVIARILQNKEHGQIKASVSQNQGESYEPGFLKCGKGETVCTNSAPLGTRVRATALPENGYSFKEWRDGQCKGSKQKVCEFDLMESTSVEAEFVFGKPSKITLNNLGNTSVNLSLGSSSLNCPDSDGSCTLEFLPPESLIITWLSGPPIRYSNPQLLQPCYLGPGSLPCSIPVSGDSNFNFELASGVPTGSSGGGGSSSVGGPSVSTGGPTSGTTRGPGGIEVEQSELDKKTCMDGNPLSGTPCLTKACFRHSNKRPKQSPFVGLNRNIVPVSRAHNQEFDAHFFSSFGSEFEKLLSYQLNGTPQGWVCEDPQFWLYESGSTGVAADIGTNAALLKIQRLRNKVTGRHYYTASEGEAVILANVRNTHVWENISPGFIVGFPTNVPPGMDSSAACQTINSNLQVVYRLYNRNADVHLYTTGRGEADIALAIRSDGKFRQPWVEQDPLGCVPPG
jgi:hypothetical protein